jgi:hypothetical protein
MDVGAITTKVMQEFATKDKTKAAKTTAPKPTAKGAKKLLRSEPRIELLWSLH